jgi:hypothetical protein
MKYPSPKALTVLAGLALTSTASCDNKSSPAALEAGATYVQSLTDICNDAFPNESTEAAIAVQGIREHACQVVGAVAELRKSCQGSGYSFLGQHREIANTDSQFRVVAEGVSTANIRVEIKQAIDRILGMQSLKGACSSDKDAVFTAEGKLSSKNTPASSDLRHAVAGAAVAIHGLWH